MMNCDACDTEIVGESSQSFIVSGYFCSERCKDMAERIPV